jgi:ABC-type multidrug transport system ATPase subunit
MIVVNHLHKHYPQPGRPWWSDATVTAVDDLSFELERGQALALWGSNGAGKTTVLKCLLGLLDCEGELHLNGLDLRRNGRQARNLLGYVPQELAFHADMSVAESCLFYANLKHVATSRIPVVLAQVGLAEQMKKRVGALSGGMKQRLALALALLSDPPVLLLDEPTSNLDAATRAEFLELLVAQRQAGKSLLFTSHHIAEVEQLADQVLLLRDGQRVTQGSPLEVMAHLMPERARPVRHIKVVVPTEQQPLAQELLTSAGYAASPNGHGIWVTVRPERKAEPIALLHTADVEVIDVEM